ncbi:MAG: hypothetical protein OH354_04590 [Candidatus Parvarchaeota archaeon]|nr:hypothetical protein [Candidatus Jingweiarchaeum tengchongense]MCW1305467.1 hypothetical protein [Candidatus Jingweiarchaeum tengchongense]
MKSREIKPRFPNVLRTPRERVMKNARDELWYLCDVLQIKSQQIKNEILKLYMKLYEIDFTERVSRECIIGALIYLICCREKHNYLTLFDISKFTNRSPEEIWEMVNMICDELEIKFIPPDPENGIIKFGIELFMEPYEITLAMQIMEEARLNGIIEEYADVLDVITSLYLSSLICAKIKNKNVIKIDDILKQFCWIDKNDLIKNITVWKRYISPEKIMKWKLIKEIKNYRFKN